MAKQIAQDEDRLKRQARRRLIGAVALTTAIVVVLPMVLDNEPKPLGQDIELRIPDKDKVGEFAPRIDLSSASAPAGMAPASAIAASAPVAPATLPVTPPVKVVPPVAQVAAAPAVSVPVVPAPTASKPVPPPAKTPVPKPKPEPAHNAKLAPVKHDARSAEAAHTEQGQPVPKSGFIVQIGAFNNPNTAHSWMKNLRSQGFKAYTEKLGSKTRVRIGPYATHEAANAARKKLEKTQGLHSNIVKLN